MALQAGNGGGLPPIVEAHAVDDGAIFHQAEQARAGVTQLRQRRQRAKLGKAKTQTVHLCATSPSLSKPAARPTGLGKRRPATVIASAAYSESGFPDGNSVLALTARRCAVSPSGRSTNGWITASNITATK